MKKLLSIWLLIIFLLPFLVKVGLVIDFKANQDFIAEVLCVNKDKPERKCNGKCYLAKQIEKADESESKDAPISISQKIEIQLFIDCSENALLTNFATKSNTKNSYDVRHFYSSRYLTGIFRPPEIHMV